MTNRGTLDRCSKSANCFKRGMRNDHRLPGSLQSLYELFQSFGMALLGLFL